MIEIKKLKLGELNTNCYIVWDKTTKDAVIIDPADNSSVILKYAKENNLDIKSVLLTHGHFDHIGACYDLQEQGISICIHKNDVKKCQDNNLNLSYQLSRNKNTKVFSPDIIIKGEDNYLSFGSLNILALHTPGHTEGSCSYIVCFYENGDLSKPYQKHLFSGDAIFENGGFGRFDLPDGSMEKTIKTVKALRKMVGDGFVLHSGH